MLEVIEEMRQGKVSNLNGKAVTLQNLRQDVCMDGGLIRKDTVVTHRRELKYVLVQLAICLQAFTF